ncbi:mannose-1-phosphate guanylyltransferase [Desulfoglaeba alkanexedens]|jgi:mannose-1-phosphate guanylyltransferase|uniref:Nucleotidyl transferase n=1 Tax=Desulfoglaeba alkanexedens ALDC TaxID=980445 RepID=A0A4P8L236_9BACT|nr:mannose-1-phosphate guanylyltransferase [Desulfoglaeba alkanexedens]QCQ21859.1 nucleotidyl transferase [Desulfoglaeba alkanexedens ALDC]
MAIIIMAGGSGTRFWPLSRAARPKQFLRIVGDRPMVRATYERVKGLAPDREILVVVGKGHEAETRRIFSDTEVHVLVEPFGRNTAPCVGLAARVAESMGCGGKPLIVLPADHYIAKPEEFLCALRTAMEVVREGGIATLGILPTRPETGYGYIEQADAGPRQGVYRVKRFVEKPKPEVAVEFFQSGRHYWNAGIFVATAGTLLREFARHMPSFHRGLEVLPASPGSQEFASALERLYQETENISFDCAVMEKTSEPVYVVPCDCGWSDVGSWYSLYEVRKEEEGDPRENVAEGDVYQDACEGSLILAGGKRFVAVLGLSRILVVDTDDALLVADMEYSQEVKKVSEYLAQGGRTELL